MSTPMNLMTVLLVLGAGLLTGCGSKSEVSSAAAATESKVPVANTPAAAPSAASGDNPVPCMLAAPGVDYMSNAAGYLFIGDHPACTSPDDLQKFCAAMRTRVIFQKLEDANLAAESAPEIAATLPEESRAQFIATYPKHVLEQSAQKCGLAVAGIRSQLVAEADAAMKSDSKSDQYYDAQFILAEDPAYAEAMWKRECRGHVKLVITHSEAGDRYDVTGVKPAYADYCMQVADGDGTLFKAPKTDRTPPK